MPEGRMLKKRVSDSKTLGVLKTDSARLLYTWLLPHLDVEGRYSADPDLIKGHIFPKIKSMSTGKIKKLLHELAEHNLIILYKANSEIYLQLRKFHDFQKIDRDKEAKSKIPTPRKTSRITLENSRVNPSNSPISLSLSKVKENHKGQAELDPLEKEFDQFWKAYDYKVKKQRAFKAFKALRRKGVSFERIIKALRGYADFLHHKEVDENFQQKRMYPSTFLNDENWKDYEGFKYKPQL